MAEVLEKYYCMVPSTSHMLIEGWGSIGTDVLIVEDEGTPTAGAQHAALLIDDKATMNFLQTPLMSDAGTLRATIAIKFAQRDLYNNENSRHHFLRFIDIGAEIGSLWYNGVGINDNEVGIRDADGNDYVLDTGPFGADVWYTFDVVWAHGTNSRAFLWKNKVFQGATDAGISFYNTDGDVVLKAHGQIRNNPGIGGNTWVSFLAHYTGTDVTAAPNYAKYLFRPYNYHGPKSVCDQDGNTGGPDLFTGGAENLYDNSSSRGAYRGSFTGDIQGGAWACNRGIDRGPAGQFVEGTVPVAANICAWTDFSLSRGTDADPHMLYGTGNPDLNTFTIVEQDINRGINEKSQKLLLPGDTGFPTINQFAMLGFLNRQGSAPAAMFLEEILMTYLVEHPAPPLTQVRWLGDTLILGNTVIAS